jgi:hypothetical protein
MKTIMKVKNKHLAQDQKEKSSMEIMVDGRVWVWCRPHEAMDPSCQQGTVQAGGGCVHMA